MNRRQFFGASVGVSVLSLPVAALEQSTEQAYVSAAHCPSCEMTMVHVRGDDGQPLIECGKRDCRLFGTRYLAPTVKLERHD